jgi:hypothetical protein
MRPRSGCNQRQPLRTTEALLEVRNSGQMNHTIFGCIRINPVGAFDGVSERRIGVFVSGFDLAHFVWTVVVVTEFM